MLQFSKRKRIYLRVVKRNIHADGFFCGLFCCLFKTSLFFRKADFKGLTDKFKSKDHTDDT